MDSLCQAENTEIDGGSSTFSVKLNMKIICAVAFQLRIISGHAPSEHSVLIHNYH